MASDDVESDEAWLGPLVIAHSREFTKVSFFFPKIANFFLFLFPDFCTQVH